MFGLIIVGARAIFAILFNMPTINGDTIFWGIIFIVYILFFYLLISILGIGVRKNNNSYGIGSIAEEIVATKLAALGDEYFVIHDLLKGKGDGNIDHIVIGPTGIFAVETKANSNFMYFYKNNVRKNTALAEKFIKQAAGNAYWMHDKIKRYLGLEEFVHGVVVRPFNSDKKIDMYASSGVCVLDGNSVYEYIKKFDGELSKEKIEMINIFLCKIKRDNAKI